MGRYNVSESTRDPKLQKKASNYELEKLDLQ